MPAVMDSYRSFCQHTSTTAAMPQPAVVAELNGITKRYPNGVTALDGPVAVAAPRAELSPLLGPNGAGKSTAVKLHAWACRRPTAGTVRIFGQDPSQRSRTHAHRRHAAGWQSCLRCCACVSTSQMFRGYYPQPMPYAADSSRLRASKRSGGAYVRPALRWSEAARALWHGTRWRPRPRVPRRAYSRSRYRIAPCTVVRDSLTGGARQDRPAHDALPGRS